MSKKMSPTRNAKVVLAVLPPELDESAHPEWHWQKEVSHRDWTVYGAYELSGTWSGVADWFRELLPEMEERAPHLIEKHNYELLAIMPDLRRRIEPQNPCLTDLAKADEKVRNFPVDRAYRIVHGLVDCLADWKTHFSHERWRIACLGFHRSGALASQFWLELLRRKGRSLDIQLCLTTDPGGEALLSQKICGFGLPFSRISLPLATFGVQPPPEPEHAFKLAQELEQRVENDFIQRELDFPRLIRLCKAVGDRRKWLYWHETGLGFCNHNGYYEDAMFHGEIILENLDWLTQNDEQHRWTLIGNLIHPLISTNRMEQALSLVEKAHRGFTSLELLARSGYMLGIFHGRYLPQPDQEKAAAYLEQALCHCSEADMAADQRVFLSVFISNGLAFVRFKQGRAREAIELCRQGHETILAKLGEKRHRLHRSVLLYNTAQVFSRLGRHEDAIRYFSLTLEMDPNYSEYYNERANIFQEMGDYPRAYRDYQRAIELSAPYYEVFYNLGICCLEMGNPAGALKAFSRSLDLNPVQPNLFLHRGRFFEDNGQPDLALADYNRLLGLKPDSAEALACRAVVYFELGFLQASLADLNAAIEMGAGLPALFQNRAMLLDRLERMEEAELDRAIFTQLTATSEEPNPESLVSV